MIVLFMTFKLHTYSFRATTSDHTTTNIAFGQVVYALVVHILYLETLHKEIDLFRAINHIKCVLRMCGGDLIKEGGFFILLKYKMYISNLGL